MHPALLKLMRLRGRAVWRRMLRNVKSVRGAAMALFSIVVFGFMIGPSLFFRLTMTPDQQVLTRLQSLESFAPICLMVLATMTALTSLGQKAIYFSPAEVDFLFPAPLTRRELLVYRITTSSIGAIIFAAFMSVGCLVYLSSWPAGFLGLIVTFQFINLLSIASALITQVISQQAYSIGRRILLAGVGVLMVIGLADVLSSADVLNLRESIEQFRSSWAGTCLIAPFAVYTDLILASGLDLAFFGNLLLAGGINLLLLALAIRLDANYLEAAGRISEQVYARIKQMQRGGGFTSAAKSGKSYRRFFPSLPRWAGVGPVLQAQVTCAFRTSGRWVAGAAIMGVVMIVTTSMLTRGSDIAEQMLTAPVVIAITLYMSFMGAMVLPLGLRGDIDHMDWLKSLPVKPLAVALGEVLGPALFMSFTQSLILVPAALVAKPASVLLIASVCALPVNLVFFAVENLVFVLYPIRLMPTTPGDFQHVGRNFAHTLLKFLLLGISATPVAIVGTLSWLAAGPWLAMPVMGLTTLAVGIGIVTLVARAFDRFDPSLDTPA